MSQLKNPWLDFASYGIKDASRFKGREEEIKKFLRIIESGTMSVLYANSGIGKTSFLNAGISPIYQKMGYFPIHIVFPDEVFRFRNIEPWLLQRIKDAFVKQESTNTEEDRFIWESTIETDIEECKDSLWWHLHTKVMKDHRTGDTYYPLLVFDQFEEIFRKSKKYTNGEIIEKFFKLVGHLASTSLPSKIEEELDRQDGKGNYVEIDSEHHYKIIFSLRKEYLSDFDYWTNDVNSISELHQNRMFLLPLKREQALKVITQQPIGENNSECYITLNKVKDKILDLIDPKKKDEIEPFMLSALCSKLYNKAIIGNKEQLDSSDVDADINNIILEIYEEKVQRVFSNPNHLKRFENALVDGDGHRNRPKIKELDDIQFKEVYQQQLEDAHLIRIDNYDDDIYIELIHDLLAKAINKKREEEEQNRRITNLEKSKKRQKYFYVGIVAFLLSVLAYGYSQFFKPKPSATDETSLYLLCIKAEVQEDSDGKIGFKHDDYWDVNLFLKTKEGKPLSLTHQIDSLQCNFHKGGTGTDRITLTFTRAEINTLKTISVVIRPTTTLCKKDSFDIDLKEYCKTSDIVDTFFVKVTKNLEETDSYEGFVYTNLDNSGKKIPLSDVLIAVAGRTFYTDSTGHYDLSIPRGNAFSNHIYFIKQGYCNGDIDLKDNFVEIYLKRDTTMNFMQRRADTKDLWEIAHVSNRKEELNAKDVITMAKFLIDDKKKLRRGINEKDSLYFVFYDNSKEQNDIDDNVYAKNGDVRKIIGMYQDKEKRNYIFEGFATMEKPDSFQWQLDIIQYDSIFNTRNRKATLKHVDNPRKTKLLFDR